MMKKVNKTVTFSAKLEEQNLLETVEQELSKGKYDSFSILCKQALKTFLLNSESSTNTNFQLEQQLTQLQSQLTEIKQALKLSDERDLGNRFTRLTEQIERVDVTTDQRMKQLQQQITELTQVLSTQDDDPLEGQLNKWLQKVEQTNTNFDRQLGQLQQQITHLTQVVSNWETKQSSNLRQPLDFVDPEGDRREVTELTDSQTSHTPTGESEELLSRLGPLLDNF
ncbi:MAG: hypothetical protein QNJ72_33685 [Pleurocapsa sp. MO_226.B13]|nr:hypothetical protein [Pleurocapsa sp. MO_226.B13]